MQPLKNDDPQQIGPYRLEARLGQGGMGLVFLGRSRGGRKVAVKLLNAELTENERFRERFAREVEAALRVGGFHTAQLVDADPTAQPPWLATAYVPGPTLAEVVAGRGPLTNDETMALGAGLAEGLAAIHECGLVHRDLKPGNVIMADDGPRIIDFGIARAVNASSLTATGTVIGTYAFMAPEQITEDSATAASDVFALGSVLVFAATGQGPFEASTVPAIVHRITGEPPKLDGIDGPLRTVVEECLAKDPKRRPEPSRVLELLAAESGVPIPPTKIEETPSGDAKSWRARFTIESEPPETDGTVADGPDDQAVAAPPKRRVSRRAVMLGGVAAVAAVAVPVAVNYWPTPTKSTNKKVLTESAVTMVACAPTGRVMVGAKVLEDWNAYEGNGARAWLWDSGNGREFGSIADQYVDSVAFSADGEAMATGGSGQARLRDPATGVTTATFVKKKRPESAEVLSVSLSADAKRLAVAGRDLDEISTACVIWDTGDGDEVSSLTTKDIYRVRSVAVSPNGRYVALAGIAGDPARDDKYPSPLLDGPGCWLWDEETDELTVVHSGGPADAVVFSPDGGRIAVASRSSGCWLWDLESRKTAVTFTSDSVSGLAFSPDGEKLATSGTGVPIAYDVTGRYLDVEGDESIGGAGIRLWDSGDGRHLSTVTKGHITSVSFTADGESIVGSGGGTGSVLAREDSEGVEVETPDYGEPGCWLWKL